MGFLESHMQSVSFGWIVFSASLIGFLLGFVGGLLLPEGNDPKITPLIALFLSYLATAFACAFIIWVAGPAVEMEPMVIMKSFFSVISFGMCFSATFWVVAWFKGRD